MRDQDHQAEGLAGDKAYAFWEHNSPAVEVEGICHGDLARSDTGNP